MEVVQKIACLSLLVFGFIQAAELPVEKCTLTDNTCMTAAVQKMVPIFMSGLPEYDVENLDPMQLYDVKFDLSGLKFSLSNGILKGLKKTAIDSVAWDTKKKVFVINFHVDLFAKGDYVASGAVLILPIRGNGVLKMKMTNTAVKLILKYKTEEKDGKEYVKLTDYSFDFEVKDNAHYDLSNLFDGNKQLSDAMLQFLNENWKQIASEFGRPMVDSVAKKLFKNCDNFLSKLPLAEIANV